MSLISTHDIAASVADDFDVSSTEAIGLVEEMLFDLEDERFGLWAGE